VRHFGPPGAARLSAQHGHIPFGIKEGCARCTTSRVGWEEKKRKTRKNICTCECVTRYAVCECECDSVCAIDTLQTFSSFPSAMKLSGAALWPTRRGWTFCQGGHISFGLKEGWARCTTSRVGWEAKTGNNVIINVI
jgi:hypothetical protein